MLTAALLAGGSVTAYAAVSFSLTMMPTINTTRDSAVYQKSISADAAFAQISSATYNTGKITLQVFKKGNNSETAVTDSKPISISNRKGQDLKYNGTYGKKAFKSFLRAKHSADQKCPAYASVTIKWNPNG